MSYRRKTPKNGLPHVLINWTMDLLKELWLSSGGHGDCRDAMLAKIKVL